MCHGHDPLFQASRRSLAHQFTLNAPLLCPLFSIFRKLLHFQPCFGQNSSSLDLNFSQFSFLRPPWHFFRKIRSLDPTFLNLRGTHPPKKKLSAPPPPPPVITPVPICVGPIVGVKVSSGKCAH